MCVASNSQTNTVHNVTITSWANEAASSAVSKVQVFIHFPRGVNAVVIITFFFIYSKRFFLYSANYINIRREETPAAPTSTQVTSDHITQQIQIKVTDMLHHSLPPPPHLWGPAPPTSTQDQAPVLGWRCVFPPSLQSRDCTEPSTFKTRLETHLFKTAFVVRLWRVSYISVCNYNSLLPALCFFVICRV